MQVGQPLIIPYPRLNLYRNNTLCNIVAIYPTNLLQDNENDLKRQAMRVFAGYEKEMTDLILLANDIKV